jgi:branched-chain amino acid transport system substrate-binding protein
MRKVCLLVAMMTAVCAAPLWAADPINIGAYLPMTGGVAAFGQSCWSAIEIAKKMEPEVLGRPVELKLADTKSDKVESANAVSRLIEKDKVVALLGETISGNTIAAADFAERSKLPMITPTATNPLVNQKKKFVFRVCFIDTDQGLIGAKMAMDTLKAKNAAIIYDVAQDYCVGLANFFKKEFLRLGGTVSSETMFKSGDRDFTPQLSRIKAANPDVIYAPIYYTELALLARQAREMGLNKPILSSDGAQAPELIELGGPAVENIFFSAHFHEDMVNTDRGKKFIELYTKETKKELDSWGAMGADAYFVLLDAIRRAGSTDGTKIREALVQTKDFEGVSGKISLKEDGNAIKEIVINQVKGGKFVYVKTINP